MSKIIQTIDIMLSWPSYAFTQTTQPIAAVCFRNAYNKGRIQVTTGELELACGQRGERQMVEERQANTQGTAATADLADAADRPGLTAAEVIERRRQFGENRLPEEKGVSILRLLLNQIKSPLVYIILIAFWIPGLRHLLGLVLLAPVEWAMVVGFALLMLLIVEIGKVIANRPGVRRAWHNPNG